MIDFSTKKDNYMPIKRNFSISLTSIRPVSPVKTTREIKFQKNVIRLRSSTKSLKSIQKQVQKLSPSHDTMQKILFLQKKGVQSYHAQQLQKIKNRLPYYVILKQKIIKLAKSLFSQMQIFKKIQFTVRRQKTVISKLYGWDQKFAPIFFSGEEIKPQIDLQLLQKSQLFGKSNKNDSQLRSLFNKMRLFEAQLKTFNAKKQDLNVEVKRKSLQENIDKFLTKITKLQSSFGNDSQILKNVRAYSPNRNKKSLRPIFQMNNRQDTLNFQDFEFKFGQDLDRLQSIVETGYRKINKVN